MLDLFYIARALSYVATVGIGIGIGIGGGGGGKK